MSHKTGRKFIATSTRRSTSGAQNHIGDVFPVEFIAIVEALRFYLKINC